METAPNRWDAVYRDKPGDRLGWYEAVPQVSPDLIAALDLPDAPTIVDVGSGLSRLADWLVARGVGHLTLLDLSDTALAAVRARLPVDAPVDTVAGDLRDWAPDRPYDVWHDRAVFHFLTAREDQDAYLAVLNTALKPGGFVVIGTFAPDGPETCSGLPVQRYDADALATRFGDGYEMIHTHRHSHFTPSGREQRYAFAVFRRRQGRVT